jgi:hypothetical protein
MITHDNVFIVKNGGMVDEPHAFEYVIVNMICNILDVEIVHLQDFNGITPMNMHVYCVHPKLLV